MSPISPISPDVSRDALNPSPENVLSAMDQEDDKPSIRELSTGAEEETSPFNLNGKHRKYSLVTSKNVFHAWSS